MGLPGSSCSLPCTRSGEQKSALQAQILDTKEFLAPIIMPHEAVLAFSPDAVWSAAWPAHFSSVLQGEQTQSWAACLLGCGLVTGECGSSKLQSGCHGSPPLTAFQQRLA